MSSISPSASVVFSLPSPGARSVYLALFFSRHGVERSRPTSREDASEPTPLMVRSLIPLVQVKPGVWRCATPLSPGWYEYLFLVDGAWVMDPEASDVCPDGAGGFNATCHVPSDAAPLNAAPTATLTGPAMTPPAAALRRAI